MGESYGFDLLCIYKDVLIELELYDERTFPSSPLGRYELRHKSHRLRFNGNNTIVRLSAFETDRRIGGNTKLEFPSTPILPEESQKHGQQSDRKKFGFTQSSCFDSLEITSSFL